MNPSTFMSVASIAKILRELQTNKIQGRNLCSCEHMTFEPITLSLRGSKQTV